MPPHNAPSPLPPFASPPFPAQTLTRTAPAALHRTHTRVRLHTSPAPARIPASFYPNRHSLDTTPRCCDPISLSHLLVARHSATKPHRSNPAQRQRDGAAGTQSCRAAGSQRAGATSPTSDPQRCDPTQATCCRLLNRAMRPGKVATLGGGAIPPCEAAQLAAETAHTTAPTR